MPPRQRKYRSSLTLVASSANTSAAQAGPPPYPPSLAGEGREGGRRDWGSLMARAQDGDRNAYRALLTDMTPYLRAMAARCFKEPSDAEDAVQDC
jgi:hypothetical protein